MTPNMATSTATQETSAPLFHAPTMYPSPSDAALKHHYLGQKLKDVQAPAVIIDRAVVRRNCKLMLDTVKQLGVGFRAHVKTHKVCTALPGYIRLG